MWCSLTEGWEWAAARGCPGSKGEELREDGPLDCAKFAKYAGSRAERP